MALFWIQKVYSVAPCEGLLEGGVNHEDEMFGVGGVVCGEDEVGERLKGEDCDCCTAMRVRCCNVFGDKFNFVADFNCLESEPFLPKSSFSVRDTADHNPKDLCLDSSNVIDDIVTGLVDIGGNLIPFRRQEAEGHRLVWMS